MESGLNCINDWEIAMILKMRKIQLVKIRRKIGTYDKRLFRGCMYLIKQKLETRWLASLMKRAGCAGINFGVDSLCDEQLSRLGRSHSSSNLQQLVQILKKEGLNYIFDLLIGGPGETEETVKITIEKVRKLNIPLAGIATGIRIYPGTPLSKTIANDSIKEGLYPGMRHTFLEPFFYLSPQLGSEATALVNKLVAGDPRFLVLTSPTDEGSYNYADDEALCQLIQQGARGAYWDIISRG